MKLRPYQESDIDQLLQLWWESWHSSASFQHPRPLRDWRFRWEELVNTHTVLVAQADGQLIGFAALNVEHAILSQIFVAPGAKRQGTGHALFDWAVSCCPRGLELKTLIENSEARAFYRSLGMIEKGRSVNDFSGREEIGYVLESPARSDN